MSYKKQIIGIVPIGDTDKIAVKVIAAHITGYLNFDAEIVTPLEKPDYAYDEKRFQYNAGIILKQFSEMFFEKFDKKFDKIVGVASVDLFVPILTYVFGEAKQGGRCALVSLFRLEKDCNHITPPPSLVYERAAKVALHELGHLFNLLHCEDNRCLMHFAGGISQLDKTPLYFCKYCTAFFRDALKESDHALRKVVTR